MVQIRLDALAHGGDAIGRLDGKAVFVPGGLPGELVEVEIIEEHKRFSSAHLLNVLEASTDRVEPPCPYYGVCGGCQLQHLSYPAQLAAKHKLVVEQFTRIGKIDDALVHPVLGMENPWAYRNHVQLSVTAEGALGYQKRQSNEVVAVEACPLLHPLLAELWDELEIDPTAVARVIFRAGVNTGEQMLVFEGVDEDLPEFEMDVPLSVVWVAANGAEQVLAGENYFCEEIAGYRFQVSAQSFFQVNTAQAEVLVDVVRRYAALQPGDALLDAYCGVGLFSVCLNEALGAISAIEIDDSSFNDALVNLGQLPEELDIALIQGAVEDVVIEGEAHCDVAIVDPPRAGCELSVLQALAISGARRIVMVSCDPATLARDVARLEELGYQFIEAQPIDMFPQTAHVETVALMLMK